MPKRTDISSILVIGAGPIVVGQACECVFAGSRGNFGCSERPAGVAR